MSEETPEERRARWRSVAVSGTGLPTRKTWLQGRIERDRANERDMPAYKRLRNDGLQPDQIAGSAELEKRL